MQKSQLCAAGFLRLMTLASAHKTGYIVLAGIGICAEWVWWSCLMKFWARCELRQCVAGCRTAAMCAAQALVHV